MTGVNTQSTTERLQNRGSDYNSSLLMANIAIRIPKWDQR